MRGTSFWCASHLVRLVSFHYLFLFSSTPLRWSSAGDKILCVVVCELAIKEGWIQGRVWGRVLQVTDQIERKETNSANNSVIFYSSLVLYAGLNCIRPQSHEDAIYYDPSITFECLVVPGKSLMHYIQQKCVSVYDALLKHLGFAHISNPSSRKYILRINSVQPWSGTQVTFGSSISNR